MVEAVQKAQELQPDLVLIDIGLPKLNGLEAGRRIRKVSLNSKILFLSQESSTDVVRAAFDLGALGYVHKLRAQSDLLPAIDAVLGGKRFVGRGLDLSDSTDAQAAPHRHEIVFSSDDEALLDSLTHFIAAALNIGNPVIALVTESHRGSLLRRLDAEGVDIETAIQRGTYVSLDADESPDPVRFFEAIKGLRAAASKAGSEYPRVAFCGERAGRLWADGKIDEAIRLEQLCEDLAKRNEVDILCVYPLADGQRDDHALKSICAEHTAANLR